MKKEFRAYLASIGITGGVLFDRIDSIHKFCMSVCNEQIRGIFVTEYIDSQEHREYEHLWFFSNSSIMQAKGFTIGRDDFSIMPIKNRVTRYGIIRQHYDFKKATAKSRLLITISFDDGKSIDLKASRGNCDALRTISLMYVRPNLKV